MEHRGPWAILTLLLTASVLGCIEEAAVRPVNISDSTRIKELRNRTKVYDPSQALEVGTSEQKLMLTVVNWTVENKTIGVHTTPGGPELLLGEQVSVVLAIFNSGTKLYPISDRICVSLSDGRGGVYEPDDGVDWVATLPPGRSDVQIVSFERTRLPGTPHLLELWISDPEMGWYAIYSLH